jgi:DNA/RNA endonuclease G (NUC1)
MRKILTLIVIAGYCSLAGVAGAKPPAACNIADKNPDSCRPIWSGIGLPAYSGTVSGKTAVCHDRFVLSHDAASKTPDWVVELLTKAKLNNKFKRPKGENFSRDPCVPPDAQAEPGDYAGDADNFEIGHMAPSEDFNNSDVNMRDTFVFSNAVPQAGDRFNAAIWKTLEEQVRDAAAARGKLYVITGPIRGTGGQRTINIAKADNACGGAIQLDAIKTPVICKAVNTGSASSCSSGVAVPVALYKIAYDPGKNAAYALVMPNRDHPTGQGTAYLNEWRVHVGAIEKLTGLRFFDGVPDRDRLVNRCEPTQLWAAATPKPKAKAKAQKKKKKRAPK